jgi:CIC family chloride channel protein
MSSTASALSARSALLRYWDAASGPFKNREDRVFLLLTLVIGALVGLVIVAFILITETAVAELYPATGSPWRRIVGPALGALVSGILLYHFFPDARGSGIPQTKVALHLRNGVIPLRTVIGRFACSCISLATGIALGREGPSVNLGSGIASVLGQKLGMREERLKSLLPVGASASLAAAFNTPIAAVLFSLEEIMGDLHAPVLGSVVLASATSWVVLHLFLGDEPLFHVPQYELVHPSEFLIYAALGILGGLVSVAFVKSLLRLRVVFVRLPVRTRWFQPVAGGVTVGLLAFFVPDVLGIGYDAVSQVLNGEVGLRLLATLLVSKFIAMTVCYSSGNSGGIFGPSLFLGAMTGAAVGNLAHTFFPDTTATPGAYALVGMGATFAGIIRTPLTSVFMIFELTRDYSIVVPLMIANLTSFYLSYRLQRIPVYESLAAQDGIHLPHGRTAPEAARRYVRDAMRIDSQFVLPSAELKSVPPAAAYIIAEDGLLLGVLPERQLREAVENEPEAPVRKLLDGRADLTDWRHLPHIHADHTLETALERMGELAVPVLPVVDRGNVRRIIGVVTLDDVLAHYGVRR